MEQSVQPSTTFQINKVMEVETCNIYSVNGVLLQQILETIGQVMEKTLDRDPQQVMRLKPLMLELCRQLVHFLFNLEAEENAGTGWVSVQPEV